jgi:hypothetical protein
MESLTPANDDFLNRPIVMRDPGSIAGVQVVGNHFEFKLNVNSI